MARHIASIALMFFCMVLLSSCGRKQAVSFIEKHSLENGAELRCTIRQAGEDGNVVCTVDFAYLPGNGKVEEIASHSIKNSKPELKVKAVNDKGGVLVLITGWPGKLLVFRKDASGQWHDISSLSGSVDNAVSNVSQELFEMF